MALGQYTTVSIPKWLNLLIENTARKKHMKKYEVIAEKFKKEKKKDPLDKFFKDNADHIEALKKEFANKKIKPWSKEEMDDAWRYYRD